MSAAIQISEERGVRYLHFGSHLIQGAMRLARPYVLELEYTRQMMLPLLLRPPAWPRSVLVAGLGAGSFVRFLWRFRPHALLTVVEIREDVVHAARQFFRLPDDERVTIELGDAATYVAQEGDAFDLILVDGYDARGRVGTLDTPAFYADCRRRLRRGGMLATNLLSRHRGVDASLARVRRAFDGQAHALPPAASGNVVVLAAHGASLDLDGPALASCAGALRVATGLDLASTLSRLGGQRTAWQ
jgi:spermidine synthase